MNKSLTTVNKMFCMFLSTDRTVRLHLARASVDFPATRVWFRQGHRKTYGFPLKRWQKTPLLILLHRKLWGKVVKIASFSYSFLKLARNCHRSPVQIYQARSFWAFCQPNKTHESKVNISSLWIPSMKVLCIYSYTKI